MALASRSKGELRPTRAGEGRDGGSERSGPWALHVHRARPGPAPPASHDATARSLPRPPGWSALQRGHLRGLSVSPPSPNHWAGADTLYSPPCSLALRAQLGLQPRRRGGFGDSHEYSCRPTPAAPQGGAPRSGSGPLRLGMVFGRAAQPTRPRPPTLPPCTLNCGTTTTPPAQASASFEMLEVSEAAKAVTGTSAATLHKRRRTLDSQGVDAAAKWGQVS